MHIKILKQLPECFTNAMEISCFSKKLFRRESNEKAKAEKEQHGWIKNLKFFLYLPPSLSLMKTFVPLVLREKKFH